ncbi:MAG: hypothetical protein HKP27_09745 [Myxococcales bacterium]|nr:hypothetical protein [Myxococcales bacterium]
MRTETLDRFLSTVGEVVLTSRQVRTGTEQVSGNISSGLDRMDRAVSELQRRAMSLRTAPLLRVLDPLPRVARDVARASGKKVEVSFEGAELELDRSILDRLSDPLVHLVRNAVDHGIEPPDERLRSGKDKVGQIVISAQREKDSIRLVVRDDGGGIDLESVRARAVDAGLLHPDLAEDLPPGDVAALVFRPGLSTRDEVSEISGRGVGMDAVKATVESLGGWVGLESHLGVGTATTLGVPVTAAVQRVLLVGVAEELVAIPIGKVERVLEVPRETIERSGREAFTLIDDEPVPVIDLAHNLALAAEVATTGPAILVLTDIRGARIALLVGRLAGQEEIYVKPVPACLDAARALAGLTVLGDGSPIFTLDLHHLP